MLRSVFLTFLMWLELFYCLFVLIFDCVLYFLFRKLMWVCFAPFIGRGGGCLFCVNGLYRRVRILATLYGVFLALRSIEAD